MWPAAAGSSSGAPSLDQMAPLPAPMKTFPPTARVYRYQIAWQVNVLPPGQTVPAPTAPEANPEMDPQASAAGMEG